MHNRRIPQILYTINPNRAIGKREKREKERKNSRFPIDGEGVFLVQYAAFPAVLMDRHCSCIDFEKGRTFEMAMNTQLLAVVQHIEAERGVSREVVVTAIEQALSQAARKNRDVTNDIRIVVDRNDLSLHVYDTLVASDEEVGTGFIPLSKARRFKPDVKEGESIEVEMPASRLGRIAAQTSRQMIMQKIRDAERTNTFAEYRDRQGDIISGTVTAITHRDTIVTVGKTEMVLPYRERIPSENWQPGDTIRALILKVDPDAKGPSVILSRADPKFLEALFRLEVSEIADGLVEIMSVSRDPGYRAKIAVRTFNEAIDPVGACVGQKGARVRNIVNELNGEKIDIVRWSEDITQYIAQALLPAKLESITIDPVVPNTAHVLVTADQFSLALGKRGQNVRLSSHLTGWHIDVKRSLSSASFEDQKAEAIKELAETFSVSTSVATQMVEAGFLTVEGIVDEDEATFIAMTGLDEVTAKGVYAAAQAVAELMAGNGEDEDEAEYTASEGLIELNVVPAQPEGQEVAQATPETPETPVAPETPEKGSEGDAE